MILATRLTCRYEAQRNSGQVKRLVKRPQLGILSQNAEPRKYVNFRFLGIDDCEAILSEMVDNVIRSGAAGHRAKQGLLLTTRIVLGPVRRGKR